MKKVRNHKTQTFVKFYEWQLISFQIQFKYMVHKKGVSKEFQIFANVLL